MKDRLGHEELDCNPGNIGQLDQEWQTTLGESLNPYAI